MNELTKGGPVTKNPLKYLPAFFSSPQNGLPIPVSVLAHLSVPLTVSRLRNLSWPPLAAVPVSRSAYLGLFLYTFDLTLIIWDTTIGVEGEHRSHRFLAGVSIKVMIFNGQGTSRTRICASLFSWWISCILHNSMCFANFPLEAGAAWTHFQRAVYLHHGWPVAHYMCFSIFSS